MKVYKSTAGHNEYAYTVQVGPGKYLVIFTNEKDKGWPSPSYAEGKVVELEDSEREEVAVDIKTLPIYDSFLFRYFLDTENGWDEL